MNSNSGEMIEHIVAIGDETFLFVTGPDGIQNLTPENVDAVYNFIHDGYDYSLARLSSKKIDVRKSVSLEGYVAQQARLGHDVEGLLAKLLATSADESIFLNEASVTSALVQVLKKFVPTLGRSILYQIADCETSVLVHSRDNDFEKAQCVWLADEKSAVRAQFSLQSRFIARGQPRLRLTVIELDPTFHPTTLIHLAEGRLSVVPINAKTAGSVKDFFQQQIREAPDVVHLLYQASKFMRPALSELFGREQIPSAIADPSWGFHFRVDSAFCLANGYFISGWISDPEDRLVEVALLDYHLDDPDILPHWHLAQEVWERGDRRTLANRFRAFVPASMNGDPLLVRFRVTLRGGLHRILVGPPPRFDALGTRDGILATIEDKTFSPSLFETVYAPAVGPLQIEINDRQSIEANESFGTRSKRRVAVVIPLYAQLGFIRSQLMAFSVDPYIVENCQIIYVLDDPRLVNESKTLIEGFQTWTNLDVQLVILSRNGGYAVANNCGVEVADGEIIVLLNSDVIPAKSGWIDVAMTELRERPKYSVVGPKLLYADDSLQHAGMFFERFPHGYWQNLHYWKGFGRHYLPANKRRIVPAVTGACIVMFRNDYVEAGGFTPDYISGDYEDSDLCLKLRQKGGQCVYLPEVELYHFERQSMPKIEDNHDRRSTIYNRALHTHRWDSTISLLMQEMV